MSTKGTKRKRTTKKSSRVVRRTAPELKMLYAILGAGGAGMGSIATAWIEYDLLGAVTYGADFTNRVGRRISLQSVKVRGNMYGGAAGAGGFDDYYDNVRFVIYVGDFRKQGVVVTPLGTANIGINQPLHKGILPGLKTVLYDKYLPFSNNAYDAGLATADHNVIEYFHKFNPPLTIDYVTNAGLDGNQTSVMLGAISDSAGVPNPGFDIGYVQMTWTDS